jgi:hypothetical protein
MAQKKEKKKKKKTPQEENREEVPLPISTTKGCIGSE